MRITPKRSCWLLIVLSLAVICLSLEFWSYPIGAIQAIANATVFGLRSWDDLTMHLKLLAPYSVFAIALFFVRDARMMRWGLGVALFLFLVTLGTCFHALRYQTSFWIDYVTVFQGFVAILFLFEAVRQYLRMCRESALEQPKKELH